MFYNIFKYYFIATYQIIFYLTSIKFVQKSQQKDIFQIRIYYLYFQKSKYFKSKTVLFELFVPIIQLYFVYYQLYTCYKFNSKQYYTTYYQLYTCRLFNSKQYLAIKKDNTKRVKQEYIEDWSLVQSRSKQIIQYIFKRLKRNNLLFNSNLLAINKVFDRM